MRFFRKNNPMLLNFLLDYLLYFFRQILNCITFDISRLQVSVSKISIKNSCYDGTRGKNDHPIAILCSTQFKFTQCHRSDMIFNFHREFPIRILNNIYPSIICRYRGTSKPFSHFQRVYRFNVLTPR